MSWVQIVFNPMTLIALMALLSLRCGRPNLGPAPTQEQVNARMEGRRKAHIQRWAGHSYHNAENCETGWCKP